MAANNKDAIEHPGATPKIVLFLGAGASYFAGYHTFATFPSLLFTPDVRSKEGLPAIERRVEEILKEIEASLKSRREPTTHDKEI